MGAGQESSLGGTAVLDNSAVMSGAGAGDDMVQASGRETGCEVPSGEDRALSLTQHNESSSAGEPSHGVPPEGSLPTVPQSSDDEDPDDEYSHAFVSEREREQEAAEGAAWASEHGY